MVKSFLCLVLLAMSMGVSQASAQQNETVVVRPKEIDDVLVNPGMGITTFQRFDGQALNPPRIGRRWARSTSCRPPPRAPTSRAPPSPIAAGTGTPSSPSPASSVGPSSTSPSTRRVRTDSARHSPHAVRRKQPSAGVVPEERRAPRQQARRQRRPHLAAGLRRSTLPQALGRTRRRGGRALRREPVPRQRRHLLGRILGRRVEPITCRPRHQKALIDIWLKALPDTGC